MYNDLIQEDVMILDNEFFKLNSMFESIDKYYSIKQRELEYKFIYTESADVDFGDLYTEAENTKNEKKRNIILRMIDRIIEFIKNIKNKIIKFFTNNKTEIMINGTELKNKKIKIKDYKKEYKLLEAEREALMKTAIKNRGDGLTDNEVKNIIEKRKKTRNIITYILEGTLGAVGIAMLLTVAMQKKNDNITQTNKSLDNAQKTLENVKKQKEQTGGVNGDNVIISAIQENITDTIKLINREQTDLDQIIKETETLKKENQKKQEKIKELNKQYEEEIEKTKQEMQAINKRIKNSIDPNYVISHADEYSHDVVEKAKKVLDLMKKSEIKLKETETTADRYLEKIKK